jgi:hypothetical protein
VFPAVKREAGRLACEGLPPAEAGFVVCACHFPTLTRRASTAVRPPALQELWRLRSGLARRVGEKVGPR